MKKLVIGIIIGLTLGLSTNAFAVIGDKVEAVFAEFTILVNGEEKTLDAIPLVYNGTSYLPVRTLANLVGYDVDFIDRQVILNKKGSDKVAKNYIIKSNYLDIGRDDVFINYIIKDGEGYLPASLFSKYAYYDNSKDPIPFIVTLPDRDPVKFTVNKGDQEYQPNIDSFKYNGLSYIKLSSLGLNATIKDEVVWIEYQ